MTKPTKEHYELASKNMGLGVGHIWYKTTCPAYQSYDPDDCVCVAVYQLERWQ